MEEEILEAINGIDSELARFERYREILEEARDDIILHAAMTYRCAVEKIRAHEAAAAAIFVNDE